MPLEQEEQIRALLSQRASLVGYIVSIVRDAHLAEDVFQEVALVFLKKPGSFDNLRAFFGWVRKVARLESLAALRRKGSRPTPFDDELLQLLDGTWDEVEEPPEELDALRSCVSTLSPLARRLVHLKYAEGATGKEVARMLRRPLNTVYVALSRIHRRLAECVRRRLAHGEPAHG